VAGKKGDTYSFGGWARSNAPAMNTQATDTLNTANSNDTGVKRIRVTFIGSNGTDTTDVYFGADVEEWQYACGTAVANRAYTAIRISLQHNHSRNSVWFDGIQLFREQFSQAYSYNAKGKLLGSKSLLGQESSFTYDKNDNIETSKDPRGNTTSYSYVPTNAPSGTPQPNKHLVQKVTSPEGMVSTSGYNING